MLLNISNHPSQNWSPEQIVAAIWHYGSIEDLPFPNISPDLTTEQVHQLAKTYYDKITHYLSPITHVHLMGEMTFVVALVSLLQKAGKTVVCSTTQRVVLEEVEGKKTVQFQFVQFRAYPNFR